MGGQGWAESRQASLPEMAAPGGRSGQMLNRRTASQYEFTRDDRYRGRGGGHYQREQGRPHHVREEDLGKPHGRGQGRPQPNTPVADIVGILHQQARGGNKEQWDQTPQLLLKPGLGWTTSLTSCMPRELLFTG